MSLSPMDKKLIAFIQERQAIFDRRAAGKPKPWTKDEILQSYRFCNVRRENDTETIWIRKNWREPRAKARHLWFAMVVARLVNWHESLEKIKVPAERWDPKDFTCVVNARIKSGAKAFTGAYMIHAGPVPGGTKADYLAYEVLSPMWSKRDYYEPRETDTLQSFHKRLMEAKDMGSFMAGQVVADVKNTKGQLLADATDWWSWAASGPGSRRGLNRVMGEDPTAKFTEEGWLAGIQDLHARIMTPLSMELCMQDLQNCLCEFDKYERVRRGEGKPRSSYPGRA